MPKIPFDLIRQEEKKVKYDGGNARKRFIFGIRFRNFMWLIAIALVLLAMYYFVITH